VARYSGIFYTFGWIAASLSVVVGFALIGRAIGDMWIGWTGCFAVIAFTILLRGTFLWLAWGKRRPLLPGLMAIPAASLWLQWGWITPRAAEVLLVVPILVLLAYSLLPGGRGVMLSAAVFVRVYAVAFGWLVPINYAICRLRARIGPGRDLFRGITRLREGELEEAVEAFERHLRQSPKELAGLSCATMALLKLGRYDEALRYLDAAVQQGASPDALALRCLALSVVGATEEALQDVEEATLRQPRNRLYPFYKTQVLAQAGRADEALTVLRGPASPERFHLNWWPLSIALQTDGDAAAIADACYRALPFLATMRMSGPMPWNEAPEAELLARMGKLKQSEEAVARTLARNPRDDEVLAVQALVRALRGATEDAVRPLEQAARRNPFVVVQAARDPAFAPLRRSVWFAPLLARAAGEWEARLFAMRHRPGIAQSGA